MTLRHNWPSWAPPILSDADMLRLDREKVKRPWPAPYQEQWEARMAEMKLAGFRIADITERIGGATCYISDVWRRSLELYQDQEPRKVKVAPVWGLQGKLYFSEEKDKGKWR